jgi:hypothetical protein
MKIQLLSCDAPRPDRRAISKMLEEIAMEVDNSLATEFTDILLDGSPVEIEVSSKTTSSAFRALRKLDIDYEILG